MRTVFCIFLLSVFMVLLIACKKTNEETSNEIKKGSLFFTNSELNIVPYPTGDTMIFKSVSEDPVVFYYQGRSSQIYQYYEYSEAPVGSRGGFYDYESNSTGFNNSTSCLASIFLFYTNPFQYYGGLKILNFALSLDTTMQCGFIGDYRFASDTIMNYHDSASPSLGYVKGFHQKILIGEREFSGVYELVGVSSEHFCSEYLLTLFYSFNEGIVGFQTNTGKTWYLTN